MFVDARDLPDRSTLQADLCIVGAGAAGIALALELAGSPLRVALLEGGGLTAEHNVRGLYRVVAGATPALAVDETLTARLGGNTNHWSGHCRPLDDADFEVRDWIPHSGWPIRKQQLLPYYERAQVVCGLSGLHWYDLDAVRAQLPHPLLDAAPAMLTTRILHACPVLSFAQLHGARLEAADNVRVLHHARALGLRATKAGDHVSAVEATSVDGRRLCIEASTFVLASGAVENSRLLLGCTDGSRNGLGNDGDLVGRFFMEHPFVDIPIGRWSDAHDLHFYDTPQTVGSARLWGSLVPTDAFLREQRAASLSLWFHRLPAPTPAEAGVAKLLRQRVQRRDLFTDLRLALSDPGSTARYALTKLNGRGTSRRPREPYFLRVQFEQLPDPANRVHLSAHGDRFGQPGMAFTFRRTDQEQRAHIKVFKLVSTALGLDGRRLGRQLRLRMRAGRFGFFTHHTGTTRMHNDPAHGVVDADCRVHGVANLFVAGSSVFPTAGTAPPTLTIIALALRLADHLRNYGMARQ